MMKKHLLITSILLSGSAMAQFTQANEPAIGASVAMYELETTADPYASFTGAGQTWDYSGYFGTTTTTRLFSMQDPASTPEAGDFPGAQKAAVIEGFMTTYLTSTASSRSSLGFSFEAGGAFGTVNASLDTDNELLMNYPMNTSDQLIDIFSGTAYTGSGDFPAAGNCIATVDGSGTLVLNSTTSYTGVLRYKLVDTATATGIPFLNTADIYRVQYEYYKPGTNNDLPLFIHSSLAISLGGGVPTEQIFVLSSAAPDGFLNTNENTLTGITVYPNPADEMVSVKGLADNATLTLLDAQGKTIAAKTVEPGTASLSLEGINAGVYFLQVTSNDQTTVERVVVK